MIQGISSAASLSSPSLAQATRQQPAELESAPQEQTKGSGAIQEASSPMEIALEVQEAKTGMLKTSLESQSQILDLLA